jgi:hypothetical protein
MSSMSRQLAMIADGKICVLFVDDERMMRDALLAMFSGCADMDVVGVGDAMSGPLESGGETPPDVIREYGRDASRQREGGPASLGSLASGESRRPIPLLQ